MQASIARYNAATSKINGRWHYAGSMPILTVPADVREAHVQAAARQVRITYARPRRTQIDFLSMARDAEIIHAAEASGEIGALMNGVRHRMEERRTLTLQ